MISTCACRKVVRRASLSDRHNLCRKEYETEAIVWRGGREEQEEKEKESDQENNKVISVSFLINSGNQCFVIHHTGFNLYFSIFLHIKWSDDMTSRDLKHMYKASDIRNIIEQLI